MGSQYVGCMFLRHSIIIYFYVSFNNGDWNLWFMNHKVEHTAKKNFRNRPQPPCTHDDHVKFVFFFLWKFDYTGPSVSMKNFVAKLYLVFWNAPSGGSTLLVVIDKNTRFTFPACHIKGRDISWPLPWYWSSLWSIIGWMEREDNA